jgi:ABC-type polysaccharide/polyol phosphate export permease
MATVPQCASLKINMSEATASVNNTSASIASEDWYAHDGRTDIWVGMRSVHVWSALGWHDIRQRYRRSLLGPFWFTLSTFIMIGVLGLLYSKLLNQDIRTYLPYLGVGLVLWQFLSTSLLESANGLIGAGFLIKQIRMPLSIHICRIVWRNFSILLHSLPVVMLFSLALGHYPSVHFLLIIPGLLLLLLTGVWMGIVLAILCLRFRDVLPIVTNLLQVAFFFTPIMWSPDLLKDRAWIAHFNPLYHLIEIVRAPMLGLPIQAESWWWAIGMVVLGFGLAQMLMKAARHKVAYWL